MLEATGEILLETSQSGHRTAKIGHLYLHSKYNPIGEARAFIKAHFPPEGFDQEVLVLGIGLGHHVAELLSYLDENTQIAVVASNKNLVELAQQIYGKNFDDNRVQIFYHCSPEEFFFNEKFLEFLSLRPKIVIHSNSFKVFTNFYKSFFSFRSSNQIDEVVSKNFSWLLGVTPPKGELGLKSLLEVIQQKENPTDSEQLIMTTYEFCLNGKS